MQGIAHFSGGEGILTIFGYTLETCHSSGHHGRCGRGSTEFFGIHFGRIAAAVVQVAVAGCGDTLPPTLQINPAAKVGRANRSAGIVRSGANDDGA